MLTDMSALQVHARSCCEGGAHGAQDVVVSGRRVPKGWRVQLMLGSAQRNILEFQEDAGVFRPERCGTCLSRVFQQLSKWPERIALVVVMLSAFSSEAPELAPLVHGGGLFQHFT